MIEIAADAPLPSRFAAYLRERFPVGSYALLTTLYVLGGWGVARAHGGLATPPAWRVAAAAVAVLLVFFHLRIFDEFKDDARDRIAHPERLVQRGIVTKAHLKAWGAIAIALEVAISAALGLPALIGWAAVFAFSLGMRVEFFLHDALEPRPLTYAVTHQAIMIFVAAWVYAAAGLPLSAFADRPIALHQMVSIGGLFAFEIARKLRAPEDESPHDLTYSRAHGPRLAAAIGAGLLLLAVGAGASLVGWWMLIAAACVLPHLAYALNPTRANAKRQNLFTSLGLLALHGGLAASYWWVRAP